MVSISEIFVYPIKGCGGLSVNAWRLDHRGLIYDRQWMLVDEDHRFLSQRECPDLALIEITWENECFQLTYPKISASCPLPFPRGDEYSIMVNIWDDELPALHLPGACEIFFSTYMQRPVKLVYMPESTSRRVDPRYALEDHHTRFSDGYPVLVLGTASVVHLDSKLPFEVLANRFRPNLVMETEVPHEEDRWTRIRHNQWELTFVKPCARCVVTTIDQRTAQKNKEVLQVMAQYRTVDHKVNFGMNAVVERLGTLPTVSVGERVQTT